MTGRPGKNASQPQVFFFWQKQPHYRSVPGVFLDYRETLSDDPEVRWTDRIWPDGRWETNLYQFYHKVIGKLTDGLKIPFHMEILSVLMKPMYIKR